MPKINPFSTTAFYCVNSCNCISVCFSSQGDKSDVIHIIRGACADPCEMNKTLNSDDDLGKRVRQESSSGTFKAWSFLSSCAKSAD